MKAREAEKEFRAYLLERGVSLGLLDAPAGLSAMLSFYRDVRADGLLFECDEDMLLFQWGCHERQAGLAFVLDMTRQLIFDEPEEDSIWQLHLSFHFDPIDELRNLGSHSRWCESLDALPAFEDWLNDHPAVSAVAGRAPRSIHLIYDAV